MLAFCPTDVEALNSGKHENVGKGNLAFEMCVQHRFVSAASIGASDDKLVSAFARLLIPTLPFPVSSCSPTRNASVYCRNLTVCPTQIRASGFDWRVRRQAGVRVCSLFARQMSKRCILGNMKTWGKEMWPLKCVSNTGSCKRPRLARPTTISCPPLLVFPPLDGEALCSGKHEVVEQVRVADFAVCPTL